MRPLAVIGHVARDVVAGGPPRIGGAPWYAGRALRALAREAVLVVKSGEPERRALHGRLATLGLPVAAAVGGETTRFSFFYDEEGVRTMDVEAVGEPWRPDDLPELLLRRVEWVHVAPLLRSDFDAEVLERLGRGRRLLLDGQGLTRIAEVGRLRLDGDFDRELLRHLSILKLAEEEADALGIATDADSLRELGVPEILLTRGEQGSLVFAEGRLESVPARPIRAADPTGAGDAFAATYLASRADGHGPFSAARRATALVAALLNRRAA